MSLSSSVETTSLLDQVAAAFYERSRDRPAPEAVVAALLAAEKAARQQHIVYPFEAIDGRWRLWFTTGTRRKRQGGVALGKGFYVPRWLLAQISFAPAEPATIRNRASLGGLSLEFSGPCRYEGRRNLVAFDFTQLELKAGGRSLLHLAAPGSRTQGQPLETVAIARLPFFAFFCVGDRLIAARGRGGGLALWVREAD